LPPPTRSTLFPYTTLFRSADAWLAGLPRRQRSELRRRARRSAEAGIEVRFTETPDEVRTDVHALAQLHHARWKWRSGWLTDGVEDRKSTRLNSSHLVISYA